MTEIALHGTAAAREPHPRVGYAMATAAAALFAFNGSVSKVILSSTEMSSLRLTELRATGAFLCLAGFIALTGPGRLRVARDEVALLVFYGIVGFALVQWLYFVAIERLPIGIALLIQFSGIVLVALWARLVWHAEVRPRVWAALALTLVGLALVSEFWLGWTLDTVGVVACVGAAIALATYLLAGERAVEHREPLGVLCFALLFASLMWTVIQPWWTFPTDELAVEISFQGNLDHLSAPVWAFALFTIVLGTIASFGLSIAALRHLEATRVGITMTLEPVVATVVAWAWLDETLATPQLIGGAVVLTGILLAQTAR